MKKTLLRHLWNEFTKPLPTKKEHELWIQQLNLNQKLKEKGVEILLWLQMKWEQFCEPPQVQQNFTRLLVTMLWTERTPPQANWYKHLQTYNLAVYWEAHWEREIFDICTWLLYSRQTLSSISLSPLGSRRRARSEARALHRLCIGVISLWSKVTQSCNNICYNWTHIGLLLNTHCCDSKGLV